MKQEAQKLGVPVIVEGTNEDDLHVYRPGIRAIRELGIASPLAELGITKAQVREIAADYGISVSERPSAPCLATRFPYGTQLDMAEMEKWTKEKVISRAWAFIMYASVSMEKWQELKWMKKTWRQ